MDENKPNFVEFRGFGSRVGSKYIGITGGGAISFYSGFYKSKKIANFSKCLIMYDAKLKLVACKFGNDELGDGTFPINHNDNQTAWISASNFFRLNPKLELSDVKGKYEPKRYDDGTNSVIYVIDLNKRIEILRNMVKKEE